MGATSAEIFGDAAPQPATPGSYGQAPAGYRLPEHTRLGPVTLQVSDLARSLQYYEHVLGLHVATRTHETATLTAQGDPRVLVALRARAGAGPSRRGTLGLYHFAILLPDRPALGRFLRHLAETGVRAGAGDHRVSEALYLTDPDGLGIEVYADRSRERWQRLGRELMLATDPVDTASLLASAGDTPWTGMPAGTVIGHVHLHVGDLVQAAAFFAEALGFDRMTWRYPGALFLGAGGYHHHLGTNTWAGVGAQPPAEQDARLLEWTVELPRAIDVEAVRTSFRAAGVSVDNAGRGALRTCDPWGTAIRVCAIEAPPAP